MKIILALSLAALLCGCATDSQTSALQCENYVGNWQGAPKTSCETVVQHYRYVAPPVVKK